MFLKFGNIILSLIYMIRTCYSKQENIYYVIDPWFFGYIDIFNSLQRIANPLDSAILFKN